MMPDRHTRFAWAKLNAYGIILALLCVLGGVTDLVQPGGANLARLVGEVPPGQYFWASGFALSGLLLIYGFFRTDRVVESAGFLLLFAALLGQAWVAYDYLGWTDFTFTRLALIVILGVGGWARLSGLWSTRGLTITIPPRNGRHR